MGSATWQTLSTPILEDRAHALALQLTQDAAVAQRDVHAAIAVWRHREVSRPVEDELPSGVRHGSCGSDHDGRGSERGRERMRRSEYVRYVVDGVRCIVS